MEIPLHLRLDEKLDTRQILRVELISVGRQVYHHWYCSYCGNKVASIEGADVRRISDVDDSSWDPDKPRLRVYCNGKYCRTYYSFVIVK